MTASAYLIEAVIVVSKEGAGRKTILKSKRKRGKKWMTGKMT